MSARTRNWALGCGAIILAVVAAFAAVFHVYGPVATGATISKPIYVIKPSPKKYGKDAVNIMESVALYAESPEFDAAKERALEQIRTAESYEDTYEPLNDLAKVAGGKHSSFRPPKEGAEADDSSGGADAVSVTAKGGIAIAKVPGIAREDDGQRYANVVTKGVLDDAQCGAIVDLRGNDGGDMGPMIAGLSPLLPDGEVLWFVSRSGTSAVTVNGNSAKGGGSPLSTEGGKREVPVAVLVDGETASSGEATMLAFRGLDYSRSFGQPTAGYSSANNTIDMYDGATLVITVAKDKARTGEEYSEEPIIPDEETDSAEEAAMAWLAEQGCS